MLRFANFENHWISLYFQLCLHVNQSHAGRDPKIQFLSGKKWFLVIRGINGNFLGSSSSSHNFFYGTYPLILVVHWTEAKAYFFSTLSTLWWGWHIIFMFVVTQTNDISNKKFLLPGFQGFYCTILCKTTKILTFFPTRWRLMCSWMIKNSFLSISPPFYLKETYWKLFFLSK